MGTPSAPLPPLPHGSVSDRESHSMPEAAKFINSQSVMAMSSLMPSASMQSMTEIAENSDGTGRKMAHNRSVSEPDFGRTSKQVLARRLVSVFVDVEFQNRYLQRYLSRCLILKT
jgi:COPII coat assembly protein SEC16